MPDVSKAVTLDAKRAGDLLYALGTTHSELGGSEYFAMLNAVGNAVPQVRTDEALRLYAKVAEATDAGLCHSLHTPALGGLGVAFAKVAIGGHLGLDIDLDRVPASADLSLPELLFSESNSRFVATVPPHAQETFEHLFAGLPCAHVGTITLDPVLTCRCRDGRTWGIAVDALRAAYTGTLENV